MTHPPMLSRLRASLTKAEGVSFRYSKSPCVGEFVPRERFKIIFKATQAEPVHPIYSLYKGRFNLEYLFYVVFRIGFLIIGAILSTESSTASFL